MTEFSSDVMTVEMRGNVALVTLNRPAKRNAVNETLIKDLSRFFGDPPKDARVIVMRGAGSHFCAGLDLSEHKERDVAEAFEISRFWHRTTDQMQFGGIPLVVAMHGAVMGGGLELATTGHVRIAEKNVIYQLPEGRRGIYVGGGASVRVGRVIGAGRMTEMMLTGRRADAEEGQSIGLSHYLVGEGEALDKAMELADTIAGNAPLANTMILNAVARIGEMSAGEGLFAESLASALTQASEDARAGMRAFLEKRDIRFDD